MSAARTRCFIARRRFAGNRRQSDGHRWGWLQDAAWFGGLGLVVCGVASYSRPAGLIAAGLLMAANVALWAWAKDRLRRREQE